MAFPSLHILQFLDEYEQSRGNTSIHSHWQLTNINIAVAMVSMTTAEITIYVIFFHHMYIQDNQESLRRLLEPTVIKLRNRRNAISFFGQFCSFTFEFSSDILMGGALKGWGEAWGVVFLLRVICFTSTSTVEVLTSSSLRPRLFKR